MAFADCQISPFFSALEELRVNVTGLSQRMSYPILDFLRHRKQVGHKLRILRIIKDPRTRRHADAFDSWRRNPAPFTALVDHVFFDELNDYPHMELPEVINAPWPFEDSYPRLWP